MAKGRRTDKVVPRTEHQYALDMLKQPDMQFLFKLPQEEQAKYHVYILHEGYCASYAGRLCNCHADVDVYKNAETEDGTPEKIAELRAPRVNRNTRISPIRVVSFRQGG